MSRPLLVAAEHISHNRVFCLFLPPSLNFAADIFHLCPHTCDWKSIRLFVSGRPALNMVHSCRKTQRKNPPESFIDIYIEHFMASVSNIASCISTKCYVLHERQSCKTTLFHQCWPDLYFQIKNSTISNSLANIYNDMSNMSYCNISAIDIFRNSISKVRGHFSFSHSTLCSALEHVRQ